MRKFNIEESNNIGQTYQAVCKANYYYEEMLTEGKEYAITICEAILSCSPLCSFIGDDGEEHACHLKRFERIL